MEIALLIFLRVVDEDGRNKYKSRSKYMLCSQRVYKLDLEWLLCDSTEWTRTKHVKTCVIHQKIIKIFFSNYSYNNDTEKR